MKKQEVILNEVKEAHIKMMISSFENNGYLDPRIFFIKNNSRDIWHVQSEMFSDPYLKQLLVDKIKQMCQDPALLAVCIMYEAYMVIDSQQEQELSNLIEKGIKRVSDCEQKKDIIMMLFSTPDEEEAISYFVDCENQRIINENPLRSKNVFGGIFHNLFGNVA